MIYFIKQNEFIKIGYTNRLKTRLNHLQVSSPVKLEVLGLIKGDKIDEKKYHDLFKHNCSSGEWFFLNEEMQNYIDSLDKDLMWRYGFIDEKLSPIGLIKQTRLENNLSMEELAEKLGITKQAVLDMERRDAQSRITTGALARALAAMNFKLGVRAIEIK
jgi:DNA-binding XRE family transcriptional regulator